MSDLPSTPGPLRGTADAALGAARAAALGGALSERSPREAAQRFEELFGSILVKEMRGALEGGFFGSGAGSDVFEGWLDEHLGRALAADGSLGLREAVARNLVQRQAAEGAEGSR